MNECKNCIWDNTGKNHKIGCRTCLNPMSIFNEFWDLTKPCPGYKFNGSVE